MRIQGVLLGSIEEQIAGGDPNPIDPNLVRLTDKVRVSIGFDSNRIVGQTEKVWREGGRIHFRAEVLPLGELTNKGAIGIQTTAELAYALEMKDAQGYTVKGGKLFEVGLTDENENRNQPPFEVIPDAEV